MTFVLMTIGLHDREFLTGTCGVPPDVLLQAAITMIAWPAPLPGEAFPVMPPLLSPFPRPGRKRLGITSDDSPMDTSEASTRDHHVLPTAYVVTGPMPLFGSAWRAAPLLAALNAGCLPATHSGAAKHNFLFIFVRAHSAPAPHAVTPTMPPQRQHDTPPPWFCSRLPCKCLLFCWKAMRGASAAQCGQGTCGWRQKQRGRQCV